MSDKYYQWEMWCADCAATVRTPGYIPEADGQPSHCPNNVAHVNVSNQVICGVLDLTAQPVKTIDVSTLDPNYARSKSKGINFDAAGAAWTKQELSWPYPINVLSGEGYAGFAEDGDKAEFRIKPTLIGAVVQPAAQNDSQIIVDDGIKSLFAAKAIFSGVSLKFKRDGVPGYPDNPNPGEDEYEVVGFDPNTNTVSLDHGLAAAVPAGGLVYLVVKYGETLELQQGEYVNVGGQASGSAALPANTAFECWFYNAGALPKRVRLQLNFKYGPEQVPG